MSVFCPQSLYSSFDVKLNIYAPMICIALYMMFWMRAYPLQGQVGGGWALEFKSFLDPVKWHRADRRVPFGAQQTQHIMHRAVQIIVHRWF